MYSVPRSRRGEAAGAASPSGTRRARAEAWRKEAGRKEADEAQKTVTVLNYPTFDVEKRFRRILGYRDLWVLKAILDDKHVDEEKEAA